VRTWGQSARSMGRIETFARCVQFEVIGLGSRRSPRSANWGAFSSIQ